MSYEELLNFMHRADLGTFQELEQGFAPNAYVTNLIAFAMLVIEHAHARRQDD